MVGRPKKIKDESHLFSVIGAPHRLAIVRLLFDGALNVGQIAGELKIEATLLSKHLRILRESEIIIAEKKGRSVTYSISPECRSVNGSKESLELFCCKIELKSSN